MKLFESVRNFFVRDNTKIKPSSTTTENIEQNLTNTFNFADQHLYGIYEDGLQNYNYLDYFGRSVEDQLTDRINRQNNLIDEYRRIANIPEVENAIDEIINEMFFVSNGDIPLSLNFKTGNNLSDSEKSIFISCFNKVIKLLGGYDNLAHLGRRLYIDGQLNVLCVYDNNNLKKGIISINQMSPKNLVKNTEKGTWDYLNLDNYTEEAYIDEEFVHINSGKYSSGVILSDLNGIIKLCNQLQSLEDLLIPLRFTRSISRRVFNIDVGELPYNKAQQALENIKKNFKYNKFYNTETGQINNQTDMAAAIVEDYFFLQRAGSKGTTIDTFDEAGNIVGEMGDLEYFLKKLYNSLKVPLNRLTGEGHGTFDFTGTQVENSEVKFFYFIRSKRKIFEKLILQLLKLEYLTSTGRRSDDYTKMLENSLEIIWVQEASFTERQKLNIMSERLDLYEKYQEYIGKIYSRKFLLNNILKLSDAEIEVMKQEMLDEGTLEMAPVEIETPEDSEDDTNMGAYKEEPEPEPEMTETEEDVEDAADQ